MQLEYYNGHDLNGFCSMFDPKVEVFTLNSNNPIISGIKQFRESYTNPLEVLRVNAELINRIVIDNKVIDHEIVTGYEEGKSIKAVATYEIENDLIRKVWFL